MEVILAKTAGFCFGVKRAVDTVYKEAGKKNVYTYGPIIHNSEVVNDLKKKGVEVINSREELEALEEGTVIIRSHGVAREIYDLIHEKGKDITQLYNRIKKMLYICLTSTLRHNAPSHILKLSHFCGITLPQNSILLSS